MQISKRALVIVLVAVIAALALAVAAFASGSDKRGDHGKPQNGKRHHGKRNGAALIKASLAPSQPGDPTFHGVAAGGLPWVLKSGHVRIRRGGKLDLRVRGLVIPAPAGDGTPGLVTTINASLYCGADSNATAADTTDQVPISRRGNARIHDRSFTVPATCLAPVVLVHPNGIAGAYIALDGQR
jgi:hypothetical protein